MSLWNYTIDDASPYLTYTPYGDSLVGNGGWRTWYIGSQYATSPDETTQGNSFHITSSNANVSFQFFGTNVALYGYTNSSFNVVIDNGPPTTVNSSIPEDSLLYSSDTLTNQLHSITLSAQPTNNLTQNLAFDSAIVSVPLDDNEGSPSPTFYDSTNTTLFMYAGDWTSQTQNGVPNSTVTAPFYQTTQVNASVLFAFNGAEAVVVKGLATSENGMYSVSLDGQTSIYNGTSLWILPDALLYFRAGLDPTITHELNITNLSNKLCLNSITVFQYEARNAAPSVITPTSTHKSINIGVIVGPVIAACCLLLVALGLFFWHRRRRNSLRPLYLNGGKRKSSQDRIPTPSRPPTSIISPMLATLNQGDRSTTDIQSTFTGVQSDVHSSHHLLKNSASYGQRSLRSNTSSDAALSQVSRRTEIDPQFGGYWDHRILPSLAGSSTSGSHHGNSPRPMRSFRNWESGSDIQAIPLMSSQASSSSGHRSGPSLDATSQLSSGTQRTTGNLTIQTSYTSASESTSPRRRTPGVGPSYTRMSTRGPLPNIPVPSYDAALSAPEVTRDEVKDMASLQFSEHSEYYPNPRRYSALTAITAPPQYER